MMRNTNSDASVRTRVASSNGLANGQDARATSKARRLLPILLILAAGPVMLYTLWINPVSAGEDDVGYYYPLRKMVGQSLARGQVPLWNPLEATGSPLFADPQAAAMHPATWLFAVLPATTAYTLSIYIAFALAGLGAYAYLRRLGLVAAAATFGALAFMFCGFMVGHRVHLGLILTAAMLPWLLTAVEMMRDRPWRALPLLAAAAALALTAGHWPTVIHMAVVTAAYFAFRGRPLGRSLVVVAAGAAIAVAIAAPQVAATFEIIQQTTREKIGYAMAGENSFFPAAGILALFPMIMGSRTPGFYPQSWWGTWHLCEMLGYVGLATLTLAAATAWRMFRKRSPLHDARLGPLARTWTFIAVGAGVWMLGYYLPTYWLIYKLPGLGMVRCPARMLLAVDLALASLAAIGVHMVLRGEALPSLSSCGGLPRPPRDEAQPGKAVPPLAATVRHAVTRVLPAAMMGTLALLCIAAAAAKAAGMWGRPNPFFVGSADDALDAVHFANPALWAPLALAATTILVVRFWLASQQRRTGLLVALLLADLFFITRFVDVPRNLEPPRVDGSPASAWLAQNAKGPGLVYGLGKDYFVRAPELLLPKACCAMGVGTIANYGPMQSPAHAQLLGFGITGYNRDWQRLVRQNYLLSLYNVRYLLAEAGSEFDAVLRDVAVTESQPTVIGPELAADAWKFDHAVQRESVLELCTPFMWQQSTASMPIEPLVSGAVYRISLDARGPAGGAANFLRADIFRTTPDGSWWQPEAFGLTVAAEQIAPAWRHFEWTFAADGNLPADFLGLRVFTLSERPIEVQGVSLRRMSQLDSPAQPGPLHVGDKVYALRATLAPEHAGDAPIVIYENLLARRDVPAAKMAPDEIERLKWQPPLDAPPVAPQLSMNVTAPTTVQFIVSGLGLALLLLTVILGRKVAEEDHRS